MIVEVGDIWIARDKDDRLFLYKDKPIQSDNGFYGGQAYPDEYKTDCVCFEIPATLYPTLTWENSPKQIKMLLI